MYEPPWITGPYSVIGLIYIMGLPPTSIGYRTIHLHLVIRPYAQLVIGLCLLDEQGTLSDYKISFLFFLAITSNVFYDVDTMRNLTQTKGNETMTTKLFAIGIALVIGTIVVTNVIGMFQNITATLTDAVSF